jgi:hypothetical protein
MDLDEILCGGDAVTGYLDVTTFNAIASTILQLLRLKFLRWMHYPHHSDFLNNGLRLFEHYCVSVGISCAILS